MIETAGVQYVVLFMFVLFCIFMFIGNFKITLVLFLSVISIGYCFLADIYV